MRACSTSRRAQRHVWRRRRRRCSTRSSASGPQPRLQRPRERACWSSWSRGRLGRRAERSPQPVCPLYLVEAGLGEGRKRVRRRRAAAWQPSWPGLIAISRAPPADRRESLLKFWMQACPASQSQPAHSATRLRSVHPGSIGRSWSPPLRPELTHTAASSLTLDRKVQRVQERGRGFGNPCNLKTPALLALSSSRPSPPVNTCLGGVPCIQNSSLCRVRPFKQI